MYAQELLRRTLEPQAKQRQRDKPREVRERHVRQGSAVFFSQKIALAYPPINFKSAPYRKQIVHGFTEGLSGENSNSQPSVEGQTFMVNRANEATD